jgi:hypothetical protein
MFVREWPTTSSFEVALVPTLTVCAAPLKPADVRNWTFRIWLYAGITMVVTSAVAEPACVKEKVCAISTKPTFRIVPGVVPVVL